MPIPTYGGAPIFGYATRVRVEEDDPESQDSAFFGLNGIFSLYGGARGRTITVRGVIFQDDRLGVEGQRLIIESYNDGIGRDFTDTAGVPYFNVVYKNFKPLQYMAGGAALEYTATFRGLT